jgi:hypothetical protein
MYIEGTGFYAFKECHKTESPRNHTATAHRERERLEDRRNAGKNRCNCGDGMSQMAQPLMFMMMMTYQCLSEFILVILILYANIYHISPYFSTYMSTERRETKREKLSFKI